MKLNSKSLQQIVVKMNFIYTHGNVDFKIQWMIYVLILVEVNI